MKKFFWTIIFMANLAFAQETPRKSMYQLGVQGYASMIDIHPFVNPNHTDQFKIRGGGGLFFQNDYVANKFYRVGVNVAHYRRNSSTSYTNYATKEKFFFKERKYYYDLEIFVQKGKWWKKGENVEFGFSYGANVAFPFSQYTIYYDSSHPDMWANNSREDVRASFPGRLYLTVAPEINFLRNHQPFLSISLEHRSNILPSFSIPHRGRTTPKGGESMVIGSILSLKCTYFFKVGNKLSSR